jgi:hypothetical protein
MFSNTDLGIGGGGNLRKRLPKGPGGTVGQPAGYARMPDPPPGTDGGGVTPGGTTEAPPHYDFPGGIGGGGSGDGGVFGSGGGSPYPAYLNPPAFHDPNDQGMNDALANGIKEILAGKTRYSPEVVASMKSQLQEAVAGKLKGNAEAATDAAAHTGMARSGAALGNITALREGAASDYVGGVRDILQKKADADMTDRMMALDRGEKWLNDLRTYALQADMNQVERTRLQANIALGYAKLQSDKDALQAQLGMTWELNQPREGRDWIYMDDGHGNKKVVWLNALNGMGSFYNAA